MTPGQVYREGAYKGLIMGGYLTLLSICTLTSHLSSFASIMTLALLISTPVITFRLMAASFRKYQCVANFSSLWMLGISIFIGGSLICAVTTFAYLQIFDPTYFYDRSTETLAALEKIPELADSDLTRSLRIVIDGGLLPSIIEYCIQMMLATIFCGSILSILIAPFVRMLRRKQK